MRRANASNCYRTADALSARFEALCGHLAKCITLVRSKRRGSSAATVTWSARHEQRALADVRLRWRDGPRGALAGHVSELRCPIPEYTPTRPVRKCAAGRAGRPIALLKGLGRCGVPEAARFSTESPIVVDVRAPQSRRGRRRSHRDVGPPTNSARLTPVTPSRVRSSRRRASPADLGAGVGSPPWSVVGIIRGARSNPRTLLAARRRRCVARRGCLFATVRPKSQNRPLGQPRRDCGHR